MKYSLKQAIQIIESLNPGKEVGYIEYEDGSKTTFIYRFFSEKGNRFIRINNKVQKVVNLF